MLSSTKPWDYGLVAKGFEVHDGIDYGRNGARNLAYGYSRFISLKGIKTIVCS